MKNSLFVIIICLAGALQMFMLSSCKKSDPDPVPVNYNIQLGAILDLSGIYSEEGLAAKAALEIGISDLNQKYQLAGSPVRFKYVFRDSSLDTAKALSAAREMYGQGVRFLVGGPNTSSELNAMMPYLNANKMVVLNCFATSPALAIPDDYIFRLIPDDNVQGRATARMLQYDGIKALVPVWRDDAYGNGLHQSTKEQFTSLGGTVYSGVSYPGGSVSYSEIMGSAATQVEAASAQYGASKVAVLLVSYQDAVEFFKAAAPINSLKNVGWYGCDANAKKTALTLDAEAASFAHDVNFLAPVMAIGTATFVPDPAREIAARIKSITGSDPDDMAISVYDAVMIYGQCYNLVGQSDATFVKAVLPSVCASYNYLGISRRLNPAGDLARSNYIFWNINQTSGSWTWNSYGTYFADGDYIQIKQKK
ncbi:MAG: ABC transporter substrate-binding protein [Bacteroidota bacterium]